MRKALILGANSAIARETSKLLARDHDRLFLVGRDAVKLRVVADDLAIRGADRVETATCDLNDFERHEETIERASVALEGLDTVLIAHGILGDQEKCETDFPEAEHSIRTNFLSAVSLLTLIANRFEQQGSGTIVGISSVAGDRGRGSNYVYGAAKGALSLFLQGLRNRLHGAGVRVITIKPGFVDTPMTASMEKGLLWAEPGAVAAGIYRALKGTGNIVYLPWFWWIIMRIIVHIPEPVFKRLKL